jgi:hypothetical protein
MFKFFVDFHLFEVLFQSYTLLTVILNGDAFESIFILALLNQKYSTKGTLANRFYKSVAAKHINLFLSFIILLLFNLFILIEDSHNLIALQRIIYFRQLFVLAQWFHKVTYINEGT